MFFPALAMGNQYFELTGCNNPDSMVRNPETCPTESLF